MPEEESAERGGSVGAGGGLAALRGRTGRNPGRGGEEPKGALSSGFRRVVQVI